jgi:regulatory helix-turn-helix LysR family protein
LNDNAELPVQNPVSRAERFPKNQALGIPEKREMRQGYVGNDHLRMIDLNLFRVFNAMMELRSAVKAGQALSITPSAVSHALNRLRQSIGDELFTPSRSGMQPTQRALELASAVREAYQMLELAEEEITLHRRNCPERFVSYRSDRLCLRCSSSAAG